jgi:hypothetical protein
LFPHLDQVLCGKADFFAIHANDDAGVGSDGKSAADQLVFCLPAQQLSRRRNLVAKTTNEQGLGCLRYPWVHLHATWVLPCAPDLYYYKGVRF